MATPTEFGGIDRSRRVTLAMIGRRAGVSVATVSKVLNGRPDVAAATRRRVQAVLNEYGYPDRFGRRDQSVRFSLVDVLMVDMDDPWAAQVLAELERAAREWNLDIVPSLIRTSVAPDELITRVLARGTRGVLVIFADLSEEQSRRLESAQIPYVSVAPGTLPAEGASSVRIDFRGGVRAATEHLLAFGHRRIGLILGPRGLDFTEQRLQGYQDAIRHAGVGSVPELVRWSHHDPDHAHAEARSLVDLDTPPSAIIAGSDTMAMGVYDAAAECGLTIPGDLSVVGFDDRPEAHWLRPPLTTVRIPIDQLAAAALRQLADPSAPTGQQISGELVVRESSHRL